LRVEDTRLDLSQELADLVSCALALFEQTSEQTLEIRACRYRDCTCRVAAELPSDEFVQLRKRHAEAMLTESYLSCSARRKFWL